MKVENFIITIPNDNNKYDKVGVHTDSSTLTYSISRHNGGGYLAAQGNKPC